MIVTIKNKKKVSQFLKESDNRFNHPKFKGGKDYLAPWIDKYSQLHTGVNEEDAARLGALMGVDLRTTSSFWHNYTVVLTDKDLILNTDYPEDELKYLFLKEHWRVATSPQDKNPFADYVINSALDEAKVTNSIAEVKVKAYMLYGKLTMQDKRNLLKLYPGYSKTDKVVDEIIEANLIKELEADYAKFIRLVEDKDRNSKVFVEELVQANILKKNKNMYKYGEDILGHNLDSTIEHLNDPKNQGLKIALMQELKEVKK